MRTSGRNALDLDTIAILGRISAVIRVHIPISSLPVILSSYTHGFSSLL